MIFFLIAALLCILVPSVWLVRLRLQARGRLAFPMGDTPSDLLRVAYLRGGAGRVVDTAITAMHADGRLTVQQGKVTVVEPVAHTAVERALLRHCASWSGNSLRALRREARRDPALATVDGSLVKQGLLLTPAMRRLWPRAAAVQVAGLVTGAVIAVVLLFHPAQRPAAPATLAAAAAGVVVRVVCRPRKAKIPRTDQGEKVARELETFSPWSGRDPATHPAGAAGVLAVRGPAALTDTVLRKEFEKASGTRKTRSSTRRRSGSSYASGSSYSSSSSAVAVVGASCDVSCAAADTGGSGDANGSGCSSSSSSSCSSCSSSSSSCSSGSSCSSSSSCSS
ncbi:TIGR04222 domain-containing membrane protein [Streptomyces cinnamoneus]|uniref:TIGR04222 domain-containing membrane protein n=1 Tax=Streptomyces cinnamoneus TaxID=53446 RepID=UPI00343EC49E